MAKQKYPSEFQDDPASATAVFTEGNREQDPQSRIAELEREIAELKANRQQIVNAPLTGPKRPWKVSIKYGLPRIVLAADPANAWEEYRQVMGLIASEWKPEVTEATEQEYLAQQELLTRG